MAHLDHPTPQVPARDLPGPDTGPTTSTPVETTAEAGPACETAPLPGGDRIAHLPVSVIHMDALVRDRTAIDADEMAELKASIAAHGLRTPIEVFPRPGGGYGLISGQRRCLAVAALEGATATIPALVRTPADLSDAYVAMVEENEIRADLSHYERGRIAAVALREGVFPDLAIAVETLFAAGSRAKRSKIRSFAAIHQDLGDLLRFPRMLGERLGLRVAAALRSGQSDHLRRALAAADARDPGTEARTLKAALHTVPARDRAEGSRAKPVQGRDAEHRLANGVTLSLCRESDGFAIRLTGADVDRDLAETVMQLVQEVLET